MRPIERYDLLLRAALGPLDRAGEALRAWRAVEDIADPDIGTLRLMPLLAERVAELAPDDTQLRRKVTQVARFAWMRGQIMLKRTAPGVAALRAADVPVLLLKGAALMQIPGVEGRIRLMDDLDVLVPPADLPAAIDALVAAGYRTRFRPTSQADLARVLRGFHAMSFGESGSEIDVHWRALHLDSGVEIDAAWWDEAVPVELAGTAVVASSSADVLIQSIAHGRHWAQDAAPRWAVDVAMVVHAVGDSLDWARVVDRARATRTSPVVADALAYVAEAIDVQVPTTVMRELRSERVSLARRVDARRRRDPVDGGPALPGPLTRIARLPCSRADRVFMATGRPWAVRRLLRRARRARRSPQRIRGGYDQSYRIGQVVDFNLGSDGQQYLASGWSCPEDFGVWTFGTPSYLQFPLAEPLDRDIEMEMQLIGFVTEYAPRMRVDIAVNDIPVARLTIEDLARPITICRVRIPAAVTRGWNRLEVVFAARYPVSPADAREGSDLRPLAIGLVKLGTMFAVAD